MNGIRNDLLYSYMTSKSSCVPRNVRQTIAGFISKENEEKPKADVSKMRRALRSGAENLASETHVSVIDNMQMYAKALEKQRKSTNNTSLEKKKLRYSFKRISSKIISSKTSTSAREVVAQAKREIQKLKAAKRTGKYDEEELEAALDHAKAMERIARKKVRHLEEEEMAKRCSSDKENGETCAVDNEQPRDDKDPVREEIDGIRDELSEMENKAENSGYIESEQVTNEMILDITNSMEDILDAIDELSDLMDDIMSDPTDMDPEDIEMMETKHRNKEMKEITKADGEYLKAMFEHYEKISSDKVMPTTVGTMANEPAIDVAL